MKRSVRAARRRWSSKTRPWAGPWLSLCAALSLVVLAYIGTSAPVQAGACAADPLAARIASVLPTPEEERWLKVPWRMDLTRARAEAQRSGKPLFLWIMEGHPLSCV